MKHWMTALPWKESRRNYTIPDYFAKTELTLHYPTGISSHGFMIPSLKSKAVLDSGIFGCYYTFVVSRTNNGGGGHNFKALGRSSNVGGF